MFTAILSAAASLFSVVKQLFAWLEQSALIKAGRNEERVRHLEQSLEDERKAHEIDSQPTPDSKSDVLGGM